MTFDHVVMQPACQVVKQGPLEHHNVLDRICTYPTG
jgi:hypothetical protein